MAELLTRSALPSAPPTNATALGAAGQFNMEEKTPSFPPGSHGTPQAAARFSRARGPGNGESRREGRWCRLRRRAPPSARPLSREGAGPGGGGAGFEPGGGEAAAMAAQQQLGREHQGITLRGSAELVAEFFCEGAEGDPGDRAARGRERRRGGGEGRGWEAASCGATWPPAGAWGAGGCGTHPFPSPSKSCSLWNQQHPVPAGHLPPRDLHPRAEVRAHPAGHHGPRAGQLPQQRDRADERCGPAAGPSLRCPCRRFSPSNCYPGFLQSGCTSASCSAWWWSSPASRAARSWSGGSLTSSVTKLQRMTSEYHGPSAPEYRGRHRIDAMDLGLQTFRSALPSVCKSVIK